MTLCIYRIRFCDYNPERAKIQESNQFNQGTQEKQTGIVT
ncbi:MAG: hypothetical protein JETT_2162 [Candidatus Jettenia ecosi]|uniref:Uncharacterized protein n=1 Tax=Candidatus Jettenia ecosi TaxID=2494326 RepID=A0A533QA42_9BACT|nr:MAG: hypothetical protein JETT_2162 [Candidatus Jettenia ecosi]